MSSGGGGSPGAGRDDDLWPVWVRWAVLGGLAAVIVVGMVLAVTSGGPPAATVRIIVSAVVIPGVLAPILTWGRLRGGGRTRADRGRERLHADLAHLADLVTADRALAPEDRVTGAAEHELSRVADWIRTTSDQSTSAAPGAEIAASVDRLAELTRAWPAGSAPARAVARCVEDAARLH